jgi:hypothetical protein
MSHPLLIALFDQPAAAAQGAKALRSLGVPPAKVSVVAATHDEEGVIARVADATPGSELEDSRPASRLGELGAHLLAAVALVVPGIGPIVANGPLAAGLGEAAGHLAGGLGKALERAGLPHRDAEMWEQRVKAGGVLIGAHVHDTSTERLAEALRSSGASLITVCQWPE